MAPATLVGRQRRTATCPPSYAIMQDGGTRSLSSLRERNCASQGTHSRDPLALPPADCELICFARKRNLDAQLRQINTTGKSVKTCPVLRAKIFRLTCRANQSHNSARLTADEGRWPSSRTRGEMRWTRELQLTCAA